MNKKANNNLFLKQSNLLKILQNLRHRQLSRADLARETGLTRAAITNLTDELLAQGLILEMGRVQSGLGRRPTLLGLNPGRYATFGVSLARDRVQVGLVDFGGGVLETRDIDPTGTAQAVLSRIGLAIRDTLARRPEAVLGIGVVAPGPIDYAQGALLNPPNFEKWHGAAVCATLRQETGLPVIIENNPNALVLAELRYARETAYRSMMLLTVDVGVGAGLILNNTLYRGVQGFGSEVGHMSIDRGGPECACGNLGCLELYTARPAYLELAARLKPKRDSWEEVVDGALTGDAGCLKLLRHQADCLGLAITNVLNLLEVEAVILAGDMVYKPALLLEELERRVGRWSITRNRRTVRLRASKLPKHPEILSAAAALMERYFNGEMDWSMPGREGLPHE